MALEESTIAHAAPSLLRDLMLEYRIDDWVQTRYLSLGGIAE